MDEEALARTNREELRRLFWKVATAAAVGAALTLAQTWAADPDFGDIVKARLRSFFTPPDRPKRQRPDVVSEAERIVNDVLRTAHRGELPA